MVVYLMQTNEMDYLADDKMLLISYTTFSNDPQGILSGFLIRYHHSDAKQSDGPNLTLSYAAMGGH